MTTQKQPACRNLDAVKPGDMLVITREDGEILKIAEVYRVWRNGVIDIDRLGFLPNGEHKDKNSKGKRVRAFTSDETIDSVQALLDEKQRAYELELERQAQERLKAEKAKAERLAAWAEKFSTQLQATQSILRSDGRIMYFVKGLVDYNDRVVDIMFTSEDRKDYDWRTGEEFDIVHLDMQVYRPDNTVVHTWGDGRNNCMALAEYCTQI